MYMFQRQSIFFQNVQGQIIHSFTNFQRRIIIFPNCLRHIIYFISKFSEVSEKVDNDIFERIRIVFVLS